MITKDERCKHEIKSRIVMAQAASNKKKILFTSKLKLNLKKKPVKCYIWNIVFVMLNLERFEMEIRNSFKLLKRGVGEDHLDHSCEKLRSIRKSREAKIQSTCNEMNEGRMWPIQWVGHRSRNCLLKHIIGGKIEEIIDEKMRKK